MIKLIAGNKTIECKIIIFDKSGTLVNQLLLLLELAKAAKASFKNVLEKVSQNYGKKLWV